MPDESTNRLREAIERTFAATAESAAETRGRAQDLLDEVSRLGKETREVVTQGAQEAREGVSSAREGVVSRVVEAVEGMRLASKEDVRAIEQQVERLSKRVAELESKSKVEG